MDNQEIPFEGKIAQKVIVGREDKILLVQDPRGGEDMWELPGGRMNIDEEPKEAMRREFFEEMGVDITVGVVVYMGQFIQSNEHSRASLLCIQHSCVMRMLFFPLIKERFQV